MKRFIALIAASSLAWGCASGGSSQWQRGDGTDSEAMREQRAKDLADCATTMGAPTPGNQSTMSMSQGQTADCMISKGWRRATSN